MTVTELLIHLGEASLAASVAVVGVLTLRNPVRRLFGARAAYLLWLALPVSGFAALLPARMAIEQTVPFVGTEAATSFAAAPVSSSTTAAFSLDMPQLLLALWLAGAIGVLSFFVWRQRRFLAIAGQAGIGPAVVGVLAPRIILPADFEQRFSDEERQVVLAHETNHLAGQDARINAGVALLQCLDWFNPLIHIAAHYLRVDQELACDAQVIARFPNARATYAEAMLKTQLAATPLPAGCYWPARGAHPLHQRIAMLKLAPPSGLQRTLGVGAAAAFTLGAGVAVWAAQPPRPAPLVISTAPVEQTAPTPTPVIIRAEAPPVSTAAPSAKPRPATQFAGVTVTGDEVILAPNGLKVTVVGSAIVRLGSTTVSSDRLMVVKSSEKGVGDLISGDQMVTAPASKTVTVTGHAVYRHDGLTISGDKLVIKRPGDEAQSALLDYFAPVGRASQAAVLSKQVEIASDKLDNARQQFSAGLITQARLKEAELALLQAKADQQGSDAAVLAKQVEIASDRLDTARQQFSVGLMTQTQVKEAELALLQANADQQGFGLAAGRATNARAK